MLKKLFVENYALIDTLELELSDSLNIITGETGAGKSILLGALGLLLGNRADAQAVKDQGRNCVVEGVFGIEGYGLEEFFAENDIEYDPQTVIRRVISASGKSRSYVNDLPVQQTALRELGMRLLDIHSQHQSLMLADDGFRTGILDSIAANRKIISEYGMVYTQMRSDMRELERLRAEAQISQRDQEWIEYQVDELRNANLVTGEQEELETEQGELTHAEEIKTALTMSVSELDDDETGILTKLKSVEAAIRGISACYPRSAELGGRLESTIIELRDLTRELTSESERMESDPERLQIVNDRLGLLFSLQHKHKASNTEALISVKNEFEKRLASITGCDEVISNLEKQIEELRGKAQILADQITKSRVDAASAVADYVGKTLAGLGIPTAKFIAEVVPTSELRMNGADNVRFLFSANKNISPAPVEKVASGGEISRLMLALKSLVAKNTKLPTIIFDEVDTGVSGHIADAMGNIIAQLSETMQVINITHLPQVACKGDTHFVVYKDNSGEASQTRLEQLDNDKRINEIAKMLSGSTITTAAVTQARLLLGHTVT